MKRAVVVGGTSGIGYEIAQGFAALGWDVAAVGLGVEKAAEMSSVHNLSFHELDITAEKAVSVFFEKLDRVDALINGAGIIRRQAEFDLTTFQDVVEVNLLGAARVATAARSKLAACRGSVVNIASMFSFFGSGQAPAYAASKGGVVQLTKSLAIAWAADGIRVNAIAPGWIATPMTQTLRDDPQRSSAILSRTPLARWGLPEELVGPVLFLTSDAASFITGAILTVDGGYSIC